MTSRLVTLLPLSLAFVACGEPWTPAGDSYVPLGDEVPGERTTTWITASAGGALVSADGRARLTVPPGALRADGPVSLTMRSGEPGTVSAIYAVEPADLAMDGLLRAEIAVSGEVPWGVRVSAAMRAGDQWMELPESLDGRTTAHAGSVVGVLTRAAEIAAVTWEDAPAAAAYCGYEDDAAFADCDGSPVGHWRLVAACAPDLALTNDPFDGQCPAMGRAVELDWVGAFEIGEVAVVTRVEKADTRITFDAPSSCADAEACAALSDDRRTCQSAAGRCRCEERQESGAQERAVPSSIEGDHIVMSDGFGHETARVRFCRQGERLLLETQPQAPGMPSVRYVLRR